MESENKMAKLDFDNILNVEIKVYDPTRMMTIGERVRQLRLDPPDCDIYKGNKKLTLKFVSQRIGLSISFLSDVERGRTVPSIKSVDLIADFYGLSLSKFFENVSLD
jgi:hypothetical protein